jgi:hypothetical protein
LLHKERRREGGRGGRSRERRTKGGEDTVEVAPAATSLGVAVLAYRSGLGSLAYRFACQFQADTEVWPSEFANEEKDPGGCGLELLPVSTLQFYEHPNN